MSAKAKLKERSKYWEMVYDAWELLCSGEKKEAKKTALKALKLDPSLADAHNILAAIEEEDGDLKKALQLYTQARRTAARDLGSEAPESRVWWLDLDSRPYMRAREGAAFINWGLGNLDQAIAEYREILKRNPNDNQGVRYLIAPLFLLRGDVKGSLKEFARFKKNYPDDIGDPHFDYCWALALFRSGQIPEAVRKLYRSVFSNSYIPPLLLDEEPDRRNVWLGINLAEIPYAVDYTSRYGDLWRADPSALEFLQKFWHNPFVKKQVDKYLTLSAKLWKLHRKKETGEPPNEWLRIWDEIDNLTDRTDLPQALLEG